MHSACALLQRCKETRGFIDFVFRNKVSQKAMDISVTSLLWSGAKKLVCCREAEPLAKDCTLVLVWHTQSRLFTPSPPPRLRQDKKFNLADFSLWRIADFSTRSRPPGSGRTKILIWRIFSLWRIADFSTHFQSLVNLPYPKICLGWSTFGLVKICSLRVPVYNIVYLDSIKTKLFLFEQLFWKVPVTSSRTPFWQRIFCPSIIPSHYVSKNSNFRVVRKCCFKYLSFIFFIFVWIHAGTF